ncbi:hypothetical protein [Agrobacterium sp. LAD9]|uniref:hypothetical protein n=1 Tax=Agrobacterium sp. LAD9 TaxID=2055153 RepID=UPI000D1DEAD6|nr:hypothetical protein [Agrobacterium sp. LAD9]
MPHVRTQLRNAVKTRLSTVPSIKGAHNMSRHGRDFQTSNFPVGLVAVTEASTPNPGHPTVGDRPVTRRYRVDIQIGVHEDEADAEDIIESACCDVEKAFVKPDFGFGGVNKWIYTGTTAIDGQPTSSGMLLVETMTYTCEIQTLDSAPDINLYA